MKLLSFAIPCYNSESYMRNCIESILPGGEDVEIIIVDDGSKDKTAEIADEYQKKYPTIVKAIHQENGGHGEAVNTGISGLHSRRTRGDRHSSRLEAKKPALLSSRDGYLLELTGWTQGSQAS